MTSSHRVPPFPSWKRLLTLLFCVLQSDIWEHTEGFGIKGNILRSNLEKAFWETAFRCVNATHRVTRFSSVFNLLKYFSGNLQWDSSERNEAYSDKGNILRWKLERSSVRNFLVTCEFISQNYTYVSCSSPLTLSLRTLRRTSLDLIGDYADKGNIISSKRERSFLRNFFVICELLSQSYSLVLRKQFGNTLFVESAKWDLGALRGPRW